VILIDHDNLTSVALMLTNAGMHKGAAYNLLRTQVEAIETTDTERKQRRLSELRDIVNSAEGKAEQSQQTAASQTLGEVDAGDDTARYRRGLGCSAPNSAGGSCPQFLRRVVSAKPRCERCNTSPWQPAGRLPGNTSFAAAAYCC
jgi:hypothetical protein